MVDTLCFANLDHPLLSLSVSQPALHELSPSQNMKLLPKICNYHLNIENYSLTKQWTYVTDSERLPICQIKREILTKAVFWLTKSSASWVLLGNHQVVAGRTIEKITWRQNYRWLGDSNNGYETVVMNFWQKTLKNRSNKRLRWCRRQDVGFEGWLQNIPRHKM